MRPDSSRSLALELLFPPPDDVTARHEQPCPPSRSEPLAKNARKSVDRKEEETLVATKATMAPKASSRKGRNGSVDEHHESTNGVVHADDDDVASDRLDGFEDDEVAHDEADSADDEADFGDDLDDVTGSAGAAIDDPVRMY